MDEAWSNWSNDDLLQEFEGVVRDMESDSSAWLADRYIEVRAEIYSRMKGAL